MTIYDWVQSDDCLRIECYANGRDRGDGYDAIIYRSISTGRHLCESWEVGSAAPSDWYVAPTLEDARAAVGPNGYTPGSAPGRYRWVRRPNRLKESRIAAEEP